MYISPESQFTPRHQTVMPPRVDLLVEKGCSPVNEDVVLHNSTTFGVFDGATSLSSAVLENGKTGGLKAAEICRDVFADETLSFLQAATRVNESISHEMELCGASRWPRERLWSATAAVVRLDDTGLSWCRMGDCSIALFKGDGSMRLLGSELNHDRDTLSKWKRLSGVISGSIMEVMAGEIRAVRRRMNRDYGVFNGEVESLGFLQTGREQLDDVVAVILYSDGLMLPQEDPCAPQDLRLMANLFRAGGLEGVRDAVRARELTDIGCRVYPRFKTHDDIAAVALTFD